jgi:maltooligosyltrehalose trehalohydrolase
MRDFHIDGLRLDAVHALVDRSAIHFLEQLSAEVEGLSATVARQLVLIAESDLNDPRTVTPRLAGGSGMDAQWSDDFHHALFAVLCREQGTGYFVDFGCLRHLAKAIEQTFVYDGIYSTYRRRVHGKPVAGLSQHRFLAYIQDHDQVGNRASGERISHIVGSHRAKIAAAMVLMGPFVPMLFQGEEWASSSPFHYFANHDDPELARAVSKGRKTEFAALGGDPDAMPDPESPETFEESKLNWDESTMGEHAEMLAWYRDLIRLRRSTPSLNDGEPGHARVSYNEEEKWLRMERGSIMVLCNLNDSGCSFTVDEASQLLLASRSEVTVNESSVTLPPDTIAILSTENDGHEF